MDRFGQSGDPDCFVQAMMHVCPLGAFSLASLVLSVAVQKTVELVREGLAVARVQG